MELEVEAGEEILEASLRADLPAVEQILFNLVDNACKYASAASNRVIRVGFSRSGGRVSVSVRDHGPGVSESDRRRIWSPFSKSAADAAGSAPGVGLGLALSRRLARQMGGDLRLDTGVREGACFVLTFPAS